MVSITIPVLDVANLSSILPVLVIHPHRAGAIAFLQKLATNASGDDNFREIYITPSYQALLDVEPPVVKLTLDDLPKSTQRYASTYYATGHSYNSPDPSDVASGDFLEIIRQTLLLGLNSHALRLVNGCLPDLPAVDSNAWDNWRSLFNFASGLMSVVHQFEDRSVHEAVGTFFSQTCTKAVEWLSKRRPREPTDWSRDRTNQRCNCEPCQRLALFLRNPTQQVWRFSYNKHVRDHIQHSLEYADYKFETEKNKSPHTLVVYKTKNGFEREERAWRSDVTDMRSRMQAIRSEASSRIVLGDKIQPPRPGPLQPTSASAQNFRAPYSNTGEKRKVDIIDLT